MLPRASDYMAGRPPGRVLDITRETPLCGPWRALYGGQEGVARAEQRYPKGALRRRAQCRQDTRRGTMTIAPFGYVRNNGLCVSFVLSFSFNGIRRS